MKTETLRHAHIVDCGKQWMIEFDVADFTPSELTVSIDHGMLTIVGHRPPIGPFALQEHLEEAMHLPPGVDTENATAHYRGGSLEIRLPKVNGSRRVIPIEYEGSLLHQEATAC